MTVTPLGWNAGMFDVDRGLHQLAVRHKGVITRIAALEMGISLHALDRRVASGVLTVMHDGIYRHAAVPYTQELRDLAAVLACGGTTVLSHQSAAVRQHYPNVHRTRPVVTTRQTDLPLVEGVTVHRTTRLPACEITSKD